MATSSRIPALELDVGADKTKGRNSASRAGDSTQGKQMSAVGQKCNQSRPPSAPRAKQGQDSSNDGRPGVRTVEDRCEKAKLLREKQVEEHKKRYEERRAAAEDRRRQKDIEDNTKNANLRHLKEHKPPSTTTTTTTSRSSSGRKLPNLPRETTQAKDSLAKPTRPDSLGRRVSSGSGSSGESPVRTPPGSSAAANHRGSRRNLTGPSSASTSCLSNFGYSPTKTNLGASKKASSSTSNLSEKQPKSKTPPEKKSVVSRSLEKSGLPKAQSTGAIHQLGQTSTSRSSGASRPKSGAKKSKSKASTVHQAGSSTEQEAKLALAEHRKKIREEAERQALLDKEKQEKLRIEREAEEKRLAEEKAAEEARQAVLTEELRAQEEERARLSREQHLKEEEERLATEARKKEEAELMKKHELERRAKELEKREREEEERLRKEEEERQQRRKRVEMIMSRTRMTSQGITHNDDMGRSPDSLTEKPLDDPEYHSSTVTEILQKVKSRQSPNTKQNSDEKDNEEWFDASDSYINEGDGNNMLNIDNNNTYTTSGDVSTAKSDGLNNETKTDNMCDVVTRELTNRTEADGVSRTEGDGAAVCSTPGSSRASGVGVGGVSSREDREVWRSVEGVLVSSQERARGALERLGAAYEGEDDDDGEEGQLWGIVEGKRGISEVV